MTEWAGNVAPEGGDVILKSADREHLRLKSDGTFVIQGRPCESAEEVADALRWWLTGSGATAWTNGHSLSRDTACGKCGPSCRYPRPSDGATTPIVPAPIEAADIVLSVSSTALAVPPPPLPVLVRAALEVLKASVKQRDDMRWKAINALTEMLTNFQKVMRPLVIEIGVAARSLGKERFTNLFDMGGNTLSIEGIFGLDWGSGEFVTYYTGHRTCTPPGTLAAYLVDHHAGIDIEAMVNKIATEIDKASDGVLKAMATFDRIRSTSADLAAKFKAEELKALPKPGP
jgi:hypothetical protein